MPKKKGSCEVISGKLGRNKMKQVHDIQKVELIKNATGKYFIVLNPMNNLAKKDRVTNMNISKLPFNSHESEFKVATYPTVHINSNDEPNNSKNSFLSKNLKNTDVLLILIFSSSLSM
uniref:Uncharacterized protein n=1 Tax=Micrurus carvalhoi TaxID=3147026 RepID=A0A2H6NKB8_9SAUR